MPIISRMQSWAQKAYEKADSMKNSEKKEEYVSFCKSFPALLHSCGLCQALAFAEAKKHKKYLDHLKYILGKDDLLKEARTFPVSDYQKLSRDVMNAATWLKRYIEALVD